MLDCRTDSQACLSFRLGGIICCYTLAHGLLVENMQMTEALELGARLCEHMCDVEGVAIDRALGRRTCHHQHARKIMFCGTRM